MKKHTASRRKFITTSIAGAAVGAMSPLSGQSNQKEETTRRQLEIAGYAYDRVRAIMDGQIGIDGCETNFTVEDIYSVSKHAFGPTGSSPIATSSSESCATHMNRAWPSDTLNSNKSSTPPL